MRAAARVEVARRAGRDVLVDARSEPPLVVRQTRDRIVIVGGAAGPVGGDDLSVDVVVGAGARAVLGTVAAGVVWPASPCSGDRRSTATTRVTVADGGHITWHPEPTVPVAGSLHLARTVVELTGSATASIIEEVSLGRTGEPPGRVDLELRVERDGRPLVHHTECLGPGVPGWGSVVGVGRARHLYAAVVVGPPAGRPSAGVGPADGLADGVAVAVLPVAPDVVVTLAVAPDRPTALRTVCADRQR